MPRNSLSGNFRFLRQSLVATDLVFSIIPPIFDKPNCRSKDSVGALLVFCFPDVRAIAKQTPVVSSEFLHVVFTFLRVRHRYVNLEQTISECFSCTDSYFFFVSWLS
jgi:hypothetical protein